MQVQEQLNDFTVACRNLGGVELHFKQGHASNDELEAARASAHKARAALIVAINEVKPEPETDSFDHTHDSDCGHDERNTVRDGLVVIESFISEAGPVLHMTTNDGSGGPIKADLALAMMQAGVIMIIEELMEDEG